MSAGSVDLRDHVDAQALGRLMFALNEATSEPGASPSPQELIRALGTTLCLDACGIFPTRHAENTSVAVYFRTDELRDALIEAYRENAAGVDIVRQIQPGGGATTMREWAGETRLPDYVMDLLSADSWTGALELKQGDGVIGLLWMIGSPAHGSSPLSAEISRTIAQVASMALQQTVGRGWALQEAKELQLLEELSSILTEERPLQERLDLVVRRAQHATGFAAVGLTANDPAGSGAMAANALALSEDAHSDEYIRWVREYQEDEESAREAAQFFEGRQGPMMVADPVDLPNVQEPSRRWMQENAIRFLVFVPLIYGGEHLGTLRICSTFGEEQTWDRLRVFSALASHIAAILKSALLFEQVQDAHSNLTESHHATVRTLAFAAEARDPFTGDHLRRLEGYTKAIARKLGLSEPEVEELSFGAVLHDVGKLRIPDAILLKPGRLSEEEWSVVHRHPLYGEGILTRSKIPKVALHVARWHHERWDGRGYPDGLSGNEIPAGAQIVTVADVFDALTSTRPYKPAWPAAQALDEIRDHREHQFSPQVVDAFEALWEEGIIQSILASQTDSAREHSANGFKAA